jgi:hypothetical protein
VRLSEGNVGSDELTTKGAKVHKDTFAPFVAFVVEKSLSVIVFWF